MPRMTVNHQNLKSLTLAEHVERSLRAKGYPCATLARRLVRSSGQWYLAALERWNVDTDDFATTNYHDFLRLEWSFNCETVSRDLRGIRQEFPDPPRLDAPY